MPIGTKVGVAVFSSMVVGAAGLGVWQTKRYFWKQDLVQERRLIVEGEPVALNVSTGVPAYTKVFCSGHFEAGHVLLGPRGPPAKTPGGGISQRGFYIIAPFVLKNGCKVLINRGWVSAKQLDLVDQLTAASDVTITGIVKNGETSKYLGPHAPGTRQFIWCDIEMMAEAVGLNDLNVPDMPLYIDCLEEKSAEPDQAEGDALTLLRSKPGDFLSFHVDPATHVAYAVTWFSLALFGSAATFMRFRRGGLASAVKKKVATRQ